MMTGIPPLLNKVVEIEIESMLTYLGKAVRKIYDRLPRKRPAQAASDIELRIDQFMVFAGVVKISGWLLSQRRSLASLQFLTSHGSRYPVDNINQSSPDVAAVMGATAGHCRFDGRFQVSQPSADIVAGTIVAEFDDGSSESFANLGTRNLGDDPGHQLLHKFLVQLSSMPSGAALEIGSRARSGVTRRQFAAGVVGVHGNGHPRRRQRRRRGRCA